MNDPRSTITRFTVEQTKLDRYLLDLHHPDGGPKAALFLTHNFTPETLKQTLIEHVSSGDWANTRVTAFGYLFEIRGGILTPINRGLNLRAAWAVDQSSPTQARFVTAYPG